MGKVPKAENWEYVLKSFYLDGGKKNFEPEPEIIKIFSFLRKQMIQIK